MTVYICRELERAVLLFQIAHARTLTTYIGTRTMQIRFTAPPLRHTVVKWILFALLVRVNVVQFARRWWIFLCAAVYLLCEKRVGFVVGSQCDTAALR